MEIINRLPEVANPLLIFVPLALMILSGYTTGRIISILSKRRNSILTDLLYGNVFLVFAFISGFIVFGFVIYYAKVYFTIFTFLIIVLGVAGLFFMAKSTTIFPLKARLKTIWLENKYVIFGVALFLSVIVYEGFITYFHPIFLEYDSIYFFLLISKSILLGDGLNQDFFIGSDVALRLPPLNQVTNAWLIHSFGYSAMRLFPIYFVLLSSLFIFRFAETVTNDSFLGLIASSAFLITPALLIISSHFSIQQDIPFIFLLCASFFFVSEIIRNERPSSIYVLMLIFSLSLLSLTREIGVVVSVAIFFLIPAMKYTQGNVGLRAALTVLSLFPLYFLTLYDIFNNGMTNSMAIRLLSLMLSNVAIFYICYHLRNQKQFKEFLTVNLKYLVFLIFPLIFFVSNIVTIGGPFATIIFSSQFGESAILHRQVFDITKNLELSEALRLNLPRADIFLVALSMGSIFVFLRLRGFIRLVEGFNDNIQYPLLLILSIVLLVVWSYLLESGFESSRIRHIAYFLPITSTLVVLAMNKKGTGDRLFYYGIIVASTYYFLNYDLEIWNYRGHFGGFYIEPFRSAIMNLADFIPAAIVIFGLLLYESREKKIMNWFRSRPYLSKYSSFAFLVLLAIQLYSLSSSGLTLSPIAVTDQDPPPEWEKNVFEIVDYLNTQERGKVLSLRAPAISFFTDRTNFDLYNPHTFSRIYPLLLADNNMTKFKERILDMDIKYIVLPHTGSSLYDLTENLKNSSDVPQLIESDRDFERIDFSDFSIYEINPKHTSSINLLTRNYTWESFGPLTQVSSVNGSLNVVVLSTIPDKVYNRAYMQTQLNSSEVKSPYLLSLEYSTQSDSVKPADFVVELRDLNQNHLWGQSLRDTNGTSTRQTFVLPENIVDRPIEARIYVITDSIGRHSVSVTNARLSFG